MLIIIIVSHVITEHYIFLLQTQARVQFCSYQRPIHKREKRARLASAKQPAMDFQLIYRKLTNQTTVTKFCRSYRLAQTKMKQNLKCIPNGKMTHLMTPSHKNQFRGHFDQDFSHNLYWGTKITLGIF